MTTLSIRTDTLSLQSAIQFIMDSIIKFVLGVFLCINPLTAPLVMGWLLRYMRNKTLQVWVKKSTKEKGEIIYPDSDKKHLLFWPNWSWMFAKEDQKKAGFRKVIKQYFGAVKQHYKAGLQALFNVWILTLPLCLIWFLMWNTIHDMAFNKSHEEIGFAIFASFLSVLCFSFLMMYLPIAQARQAVNENWRRFFDIRIIMTIARQVRIRLFIMAVIYGLGSFGFVLATKTIMANFEGFYALNMDDVQAVEDKVFNHYLMVSVFFFAGLLFLKRMSAKIYAIALLKAVHKGVLKEEQLTDLEYNILIKKLHHHVKSKPEPHAFFKVIKWPFRHASNMLLILITLAVWGLFVVTIYIGQFINIHYMDWLSHPFIHMPYIRIPEINGF